MFDTKFLITVTYLIVVTIIHHGFADDYQRRCENLMSGFWFDTQSTGEHNFQIAFYNLTTASINAYLVQKMTEIPPGSSHSRGTLIVQGALLRGYFSSLFSNHGLVLANCFGKMKEWCEGRVEIVSNIMFQEIGIRHKTKHCTKAITKKFKIDVNETRANTYELFYKNWTLDGLRISTNEGGPSSSSNPSISVNRENDDVITNYPLHYFKFYENG